MIQKQLLSFLVLLLLLFENVGNARLGDSNFTFYQSIDPIPTILTHRNKDVIRKTVDDKKGTRSLGK